MELQEGAVENVRRDVTLRLPARPMLMVSSETWALENR